MASYDMSGFRPLVSGAANPLGNREGNFCHWLSTVRLSRVLIGIFVVLVILPIVTHYYISNVAGDPAELFRVRNKLELPEDLGSLKAGELKVRIEELLRIKNSVNNELRDLEAKRQKLLSEISTFGLKIEELKNEAGRKQIDLERIKLSINQAEVAHKEILERNQPELGLPTRLLPIKDHQVNSAPSQSETASCSTHSCVDFSRCS